LSFFDDWKHLLRGRAGRRFLDFHQARCKRRAGGWPLERVLTLFVGTVLLLGGLAIGWLPGPGGFIAVFGAALLGVEWLRVARLLDRCEAYLRSFLRFLRRRVLSRARAAD
jgi:hypothetical protein